MRTEERIQEILRSDLGFDFDPVVQRAHRMGPIKRCHFRIVGQRQDSPLPRPIIVCFRDYKDVLVILENAHKLRGTTIGINKDFPKEINDTRSELWPLYKRECEKHSKSAVYIGFPAKLVVENCVVKDLFPDWREVLKRSRQSGGEQPAQGNAQTGAPSAPGRKRNQINVPDTNDNQSCDSDMESVHSSADRDPSTPDHDSTSVKDTLVSTGPDAKPTAYDEAMGRLLERMCNQVPTQRESGSTNMPDKPTQRTRSEQRAPINLETTARPTNSKNTPCPEPKEK